MLAGKKRVRVNPLTRFICLSILKFIFLTPFRIIRYVFKQRHIVQEDTLECTEEEEYVLDDPNPLATCPEFMQIIDIDKDTVIGIESIEWSPDETALLRVLTETNVSKPFKKRVYRCKKDRYIKIGSDKIYLK